MRVFQGQQLGYRILDIVQQKTFQRPMEWFSFLTRFITQHGNDFKIDLY